jgi:carbon storage regulator
MLVLSRKRDESVIVGNGDVGQPVMKITVLAMRGGKVTLGFDVPDDVPIHRWEIWQRIQANGDCGTTVPDVHVDERHGLT